MPLAHVSLPVDLCIKISAKADIQINRGSRDTRALRFETAGWQRQNALKARSLTARSSLCQNRIHPVAGWLWKKPCRTQCKTGLSLKSANKTEIRKMPKNKLFAKETLKGLRREKITLYGSVAHLGMSYCRKGLKKAEK